MGILIVDDAGTQRKGPEMVISADDVRKLLAAAPDAVMVLIEGRAAVVSPADLDSPAYQGALQVTTCAELADRVGGTTVSDRELVELAADLDTAVSELGG